MFDLAKQRVMNDEHRWKPRPGDLWEDHMVLVCIVLEVSDGQVTFCRTKKDADSSGRWWTWDLDKVQTKFIQEFAKEFLYDKSESFGPKDCWANVCPEVAKDSFLPLWEAHKLKASTPESTTPNRDNFR
jgi:hypothetical protein